MGEIKGQILGIITVLTVFGAVSVALAGAYKTATDNIATQITEITEKADTSELKMNELLRF